eukprot:4328502-Alexandrium_andersonii.AAC.1
MCIRDSRGLRRSLKLPHHAAKRARDPADAGVLEALANGGGDRVPCVGRSFGRLLTLMSLSVSVA